MRQGMTMAEKVLARASGRDTGATGEFVTARIDILMAHDGSFDDAYALMLQSGHQKVWDPDKIVVGIDHRVPAPNIAYAERQKKMPGIC